MDGSCGGTAASILGTVHVRIMPSCFESKKGIVNAELFCCLFEFFSAAFGLLLRLSIFAVIWSFFWLGIPAWCSSINDILKWDDKDDRKAKMFLTGFFGKKFLKASSDRYHKMVLQPWVQWFLRYPWHLGRIGLSLTRIYKVEGKHVPISQTATEQFDIQILNSLKIQGPWEKGSAVLTTGEGWLAESWR